jgi:hypothetical protein
MDVFYSLQKKVGQEIDGLFSQLQSRQKELKGYEKADLPLVEKSVNYFFLYLLLEAYAQSDYLTAKTVKPFINTNLLTREDRNELGKVVLRMKLFPPFLKRLYNRFSQVN